MLNNGKNKQNVECGAPDSKSHRRQIVKKKKRGEQKNEKKFLRTGLRPPFRFCVWATSCVKASTSTSGVETDGLTEPSRMGSDLVATDSMAGSLLFSVDLEEASTMETSGLGFLSSS